MDKLTAARAGALFLLLAGGCVSITKGAFTIAEPAGFIVGGLLAIIVSLFLAYLSGAGAK